MNHDILAIFKILYVSMTELFRMMAQPGSEVGLMINFFIALIVALSSIRLIHLYFSLRKEQGAIKKATKLATQLKDDTVSKSDKATHEYFVGLKDQLLEGVSEKSLVARRASSLIKLRYVSKGAIEALSKVDEDQAHVRLSTVRYAATVPIVFGLIGTLWGLSLAITEIQPLISQFQMSEGLQELLKMLGNTLRGMKTAFTTSIAGLIAGVFLSFFATRISRLYQSVLRDLEQTSALELIPLLSIPEEIRAKAAFTEALKDSSRNLRDATVSMQNWTSNLVSAVNKTHEGVDGILQVVASFADGTEKLEKFQTEFQEKILDHNERLGKTMDDVIQMANGIGSSHRQLEGILNKMEEAHRKTSKIIDEHESVNEKAKIEFETALTKVVETTKEAVGQLEKVAEHVGDTNPTKVAKALEDVLDVSKQPFVDFFDGVSLKVHEELSNQLNSHFTKLQNTNAEFAQEMANSRKIVQTQFENTVQKSLESIDALHKKILNQQKDLLEGLASSAQLGGGSTGSVGESLGDGTGGDKSEKRSRRWFSSGRLRK